MEQRPNNKSLHTKLTLEKKILLPFLPVMINEVNCVVVHISDGVFEVKVTHRFLTLQ